MTKNKLVVLILAVIVVTAFLTLLMNAADLSKPTKNEIDTAVNQASLLYKYEQEKGRDLSNGPCLSDALMPNWVVDIAHNPRLPIDDKWENQCPSYVGGRSEHFVELDTEGNLIRAQ